MADCLVHSGPMRNNHFQPGNVIYPHSFQVVSRGGKYGSMSGGSSLSQSMRYAESWLYGGANGRASLFGTVRAPKSRPRLAEDPYQAMRKSRLVMGTTSPVRKSILECDIDPYRLVEDSSGDEEQTDAPKRPPRSRVRAQPKGILKKEARPPPRPVRASFKEFRRKKQVQFNMPAVQTEVPPAPMTENQNNVTVTAASTSSPVSSPSPSPDSAPSPASDSAATPSPPSCSIADTGPKLRRSLSDLRPKETARLVDSLRRPIRPARPPPPPPRHVFPFTPKQIEAINRTRPPCVKVLALEPPPSNDNAIKVLVPYEENRTVVSVGEPKRSKSSVVIGPEVSKLTITVNGFQEDSITVNEQSSCKTLLIVDHVSELRNILNGEAEMKKLVKHQVDPVQAARNNLVPHVCGKPEEAKTDSKGVSGKECNRPQDVSKEIPKAEPKEQATLKDPPKDPPDLIGDSVREIEKIGTELSSAYESESDKGYEASEPSSDSSDKPYDTELYQEKDKVVDELEISLGLGYDSSESHYETIRDPIYEEIPDEPPPLPLSPPPEDPLMPKSIFEGATKYDILSYLATARQRVDAADHSRSGSMDYSRDGHYSAASAYSQLSSASDSSEDSAAASSTEISLIDEMRKSSEVERNDSGVGSETSRSRWQHVSNGAEDQLVVCEDCDQHVDVPDVDGLYCLVCRKCNKRRAERREIITEIVETEEKYGRDLTILMEEFYRPMLVAGLLSQEQLSSIFLNSEELVEHNATLAEKLRDALEIALEQGDEDLLTVNVGAIFLEAAPMLHAFQSYCTRQGSAAMLLANLEKEKELLRIFLRVSQMENSVLRRMNLNSFLMVPVQRVTKYPLLLSRLYKVTPHHIVGRELIKQAQQTIALHLDHINYLTKDLSPTKLWRRISVTSGKKCGSEAEMINIKLRKIAVDVLDWNVDEVRFTIEGKLLYTQPTDNNWKRRATIKLVPVNAILVTLGKPNESYQDCADQDSAPLFSRSNGIKEAGLVLLREKSGRYSLVREPLFLDRCIVCAESDFDEYFEIQELPTKDTYIFKAEDNEATKRWYCQLQYHAQGLGTWRKRRNALANIMINGMLLRM